MPLLKSVVGGRKIAARILTHAHSDHIDGFVPEFERSGGVDFDITQIYCNFPPYEWIENHDVPGCDCFRPEPDEMLNRCSANRAIC